MYAFEKAAQRNLLEMALLAEKEGFQGVDCRPTRYVLPGVRGQEDYFKREEEVTRRLLATDATQAEALKSMRALNAEQVTELLKSAPGFFSCGLLMTDSHAINPAAFVYAIAGMAAKRGVKIHERTRVTAIEPHSDGKQVVLRATVTREDGTPSHSLLINARTVVIGTNGQLACQHTRIALADELLVGYLPNIKCKALEELQSAHMTVNSCLLATEPLDDKQRASIGVNPDFTFVEVKLISAVIVAELTRIDVLLQPPNFGDFLLSVND